MMCKVIYFFYFFGREFKIEDFGVGNDLFLRYRFGDDNKILNSILVVYEIEDVFECICWIFYFNMI